MVGSIASRGGGAEAERLAVATCVRECGGRDVRVHEPPHDLGDGGCSWWTGSSSNRIAKLRTSDREAVEGAHLDTGVGSIPISQLDY